MNFTVYSLHCCCFCCCRYCSCFCWWYSLDHLAVSFAILLSLALLVHYKKRNSSSLSLWSCLPLRRLRLWFVVVAVAISVLAVVPLCHHQPRPCVDVERSPGPEKSPKVNIRRVVPLFWLCFSFAFSLVLPTATSPIDCFSF